MNAPDHFPTPLDPFAGAWAHYDAWAKAYANHDRARQRISAATATKYRSIWSGWLHWLAKDGRLWDQAAQSDVSAYIQSLATSRSARGRTGTRNASPVTQHRYWRVLHDIYAHATQNNQVVNNPCLEAEAVPASEKMASMLLPPFVLGLIQSGVIVERQSDPARSWQDTRDDAMLLLMCHTALKAGEIRALRVDQVIPTRNDTKGEYMVLTLDAVGKKKKRELELTDPQLLVVLRQWLFERRAIEDLPPWLFFGRRRHADTRQRSALSLKSIFLTVNQAIARHVRKDALSYDLAHAGPEAIRNTVLSRWLAQGVDPKTVMDRAGFKESRALMRLMPAPAGDQ